MKFWHDWKREHNINFPESQKKHILFGGGIKKFSIVYNLFFIRFSSFNKHIEFKDVKGLLVD